MALKFPICLAAASAVKPSLPLNLVFYPQFNIRSRTTSFYANFVINFVLNYLLYLTTTVQGYTLVLELLAYIMSVAFVQQLVDR